MKRILLIIMVIVISENLYADDNTKLRCYLSTDIPLYYMDFDDTDNPDDYYWGTGIIPSGLNLDVGLMYGVLGVAASAELSFSGENSGNSAFGVGDYFHLDLRLGPEMSTIQGRHLVAVNFSFQFEYYKELNGATSTAATAYDETYDTTTISTVRSGHRLSFYQYFRYNYLVMDHFGVGPKIVLAEGMDGSLLFSVNFNFIYVF